MGVFGDSDFEMVEGVFYFEGELVVAVCELSVSQHSGELFIRKCFEIKF